MIDGDFRKPLSIPVFVDRHRLENIHIGETPC